MKRAKYLAIAIIGFIAIIAGVSFFGIEGVGAVLAIAPLAFLDDVPDLSEKDKKMAEGIVGQVNDLVQKAQLGMIKEDYFEKKMTEFAEKLSAIEALTDKKAMQEQLDNLTKEVKKMSLKGGADSNNSPLMQIKEALTPEKLAELKQKGGKLNLDIKVASDMLISTNTTGEVARVDRKPGVVWDAESMPMLTTVIPTAPTSGNSVEITEAYDEQGAPIFHVEGDAGAQMSWKWRTKNFAVKDVSVWAKFSKNILDDVDNFLAQIQQKLFMRLDKAVDAKLLAGDEDANPEEFDGLVTIATAFDNNSKKTYKPTERDVLIAAIGQAQAYDHNPNVAVIHPLDMTSLKLAKAGKDNAILQFEDVANSLAGLRIVTSTRMTQGKFLVFDSSKAMQHVRLALELTTTDSDSTDFTKRLMTLNLTKRLAFEVSANNYKAFVYGDFATAKTAMTLTT